MSLDELGRILARNGFAIVDKKKFVTTSDLLNKISPSATPAKAAGGNDGGSMLQMAAAAVVGMGVAAVGTFLLMNKNK